MINVSARDLNVKIRIQYKTTAKNDNGFPVETWHDLGGVNPGDVIIRWAKWQWLHGSEFWAAAAVQSEVAAEVTIRYVSGITPDMRVLYKDKAYEIIPPIDNVLEQNRFIVFKVKAVG
jgi:SPP1 family predicted phage head-tail adaptor